MTDEMAICLVTLSEPELKCEPTTLQPMSLPGTGLLPSNNLSPGSLPSPATISNTCFHCSQSWLVKTVGMPTAFLAFRTLTLSSWDECINSGRITFSRAPPLPGWKPFSGFELPTCLRSRVKCKKHVPCSPGHVSLCCLSTSPRGLCKSPPLLRSSHQGSELGNDKKVKELDHCEGFLR